MLQINPIIIHVIIFYKFIIKSEAIGRSIKSVRERWAVKLNNQIATPVGQ